MLQTFVLKLRTLVFASVAAFCPSAAHAGAQVYEPLSASVRAGLQASIADDPAPTDAFPNSIDAVNWLTAMALRLQTLMPSFRTRLDLLRTAYYEASRAGLDPQLILAVVNVESNFRKYAISAAGARGYMQVMPFWVDLIGRKGDDLFDLRTNFRYGCVILRHYLDVERGNLTRALERYNGSLGDPEYSNQVIQLWRTRWRYSKAAESAEN